MNSSGGIRRDRSLSVFFIAMIIVTAFQSPGLCGETEPSVSSRPICFGNIVFENPVDDIIISYSNSIDFSGEFYAHASVWRTGSKTILAEIYYGLPAAAPAPLENVPSTKINLGSVIASMSCITKGNGQKTCHVSVVPYAATGGPLVFYYHDLSEPDSLIADKMWRSAHTDDRCKGEGK